MTLDDSTLARSKAFQENPNLDGSSKAFYAYCEGAKWQLDRDLHQMMNQARTINRQTDQIDFLVSTLEEISRESGCSDQFCLRKNEAKIALKSFEDLGSEYV